MCKAAAEELEIFPFYPAELPEEDLSHREELEPVDTLPGDSQEASQEDRPYKLSFPVERSQGEGQTCQAEKYRTFGRTYQNEKVDPVHHAGWKILIYGLIRKGNLDLDRRNYYLKRIEKIERYSGLLEPPEGF